jgi:uncharacterized damage-inducible protein DinB
VSIADAILGELDREFPVARRMIERLPDDKLAWKPHPKSFSLGGLAFHLAASLNMQAEALLVDSYEFGPRPCPDGITSAEILSAYDRSTAMVREAVQQTEDACFLATWTGTAHGKPVLVVPRIGFVRTVILNHHYHHRGQLSVYLRLLDIPVPMIYGPTADENPFN